MADHFIGVNRGTIRTDASIVRGTSTGSTDVEVRIADAAGWTRNELIDAIKRLTDYLAQPDTHISTTHFPVK